MRPLTPSLAALVLGLTSEQGEPLGWNAALANATAAGGVGVALDAADGATVLHIVVPALREYDISTADDLAAGPAGGDARRRRRPPRQPGHRPPRRRLRLRLARDERGEAEVRANR